MRNVVYVPPGPPTSARQVPARKEAEEARKRVLQLAEAIRALDQSQDDHDPKEDRVFLTQHPYPLGKLEPLARLKNLLGHGEKLDGTATFEDGKLVEFKAQVYDTRGGSPDARSTRFYFYEEKNDRVRWGAPKNVERTRETVSEIHNGARVYRTEKDVLVDYTLVQQTWEGELFVHTSPFAVFPSDHDTIMYAGVSLLGT